MKTYQKILAAIDFSPHSQAVAEHATSLARDLNAELILINVINQRDIDAIYYAIDHLPGNGDKISAKRCIDQLHQDREKKMDDLKAAVDMSGIKSRFITKSGIPFQALMEAIEEEQADMLVVGIKGRSDIADVVVGSTALKMMKRCPTPMLTVRNKA